MIQKGQIVEIPASSSIYAEDFSIFPTKKDELMHKITKRNYNLFDGFLVGEHPGVEHFKLGQRKGINVGGKDAPLYVIDINETNNQLFVGQGEQHPGLWTTVISFDDNQMEPKAIDSDENQFEIGFEVQIASPAIETEITSTFYQFGNTFFLEFQQPVSIAIQNHPLEIIFASKHTATISIIK